MANLDTRGEAAPTIDAVTAMLFEIIDELRVGVDLALAADDAGTAEELLRLIHIMCESVDRRMVRRRLS